MEDILTGKKFCGNCSDDHPCASCDRNRILEEMVLDLGFQLQGLAYVEFSDETTLRETINEVQARCEKRDESHKKQIDNLWEIYYG